MSPTFASLHVRNYRIYATGSVVSSLYHLKDTENNGQDAGFFVFPDLCVRTEGSYRLKLILYEVVE